MDARGKPGHDDSAAVIPGRVENANPESRDSPMCNCTSEVWSFGPSRNDARIFSRVNSFITFVDIIFTTFSERPFTNAFDDMRQTAAIACVVRAGNAD